MRRPSDNRLVPNEKRVLLAAASLRSGGEEFHGYLLAGELRRARPHKRVMAYSTLYRCLDRLVERGYVRVVEAVADSESGGPPRKHFAVTDQGLRMAAGLRDNEDESFTWGLA